MIVKSIKRNFSYLDSLSKIYKLALHPPKRHNSLDDMRFLSNLFGNPQENFKTIHIAGTNGKGSVSLKIATALINSGIFSNFLFFRL